MDQARAFALAARLPDFRLHVLGNAHATANAMADGPHKARVKAAIGDAGDALEHFQALVFAVYPAAMTYRADMPEAELRAWAWSVMEVLRDAP